MNGSGDSTSTLNTSSISARSLAAITSKIRASIANPASTKQIPVKIVQKSAPRGIHFGTKSSWPSRPLDAIVRNQLSKAQKSSGQVGALSPLVTKHAESATHRQLLQRQLE